MRELTGRHVLFITVSAFGVIIAVNVAMAYFAVSTFPGLEVDNSYVASQTFDQRRDAQTALGWNAAAEYDPQNARLVLKVTDADGLSAPLKNMQVLIGRTTEAREDKSLEPRFAGAEWESFVPLEQGKWMLKVTGTARDGTAFEQRLDLYIRG